MSVPVAFIASPYRWQQEANRYLHTYSSDVDVVAIVADLRDLYATEWRVVFVDASSPWLSADLVGSVHGRGRGVVAMVDPSDLRRLGRARQAGVDALLDWDATHDDLISTVLTVARLRPAKTGHTAHPTPSPSSAPRSPVIAVGGPPGVRPERYALALAAAFADKGEKVVVVDANDTDPGLAPRLLLHPEPNVVSLAVNPDPGAVVRALQPVADGGFWAVPGLVDPKQWASVNARGVRRLLGALSSVADRVVVVVGPVVEDLPRHSLTLTALGAATQVVPVGEATPLGLSSLTAWVSAAKDVADQATFWPLASHASLGRSELADVAGWLTKVAALAPGPGTVTLVPSPARAERRGSWDGRLYRDRTLRREMGRLAEEMGRLAEEMSR